MNILIDGLPTDIDGIEIYTDFRNMLQFTELMDDEGLTPHEKTMLAVGLLYKEPPDDLATAISGLNWFYSCGKEEDEETGTGESGNKAICFEQDQLMIFNAFLSLSPSVDLSDLDTKIHWWAFLGILKELNSECELKQAMYYRTCDISKMSKDQKSHAHKMRTKYTIRDSSNPLKALSLAERDALLIKQTDERSRRAHEGV